MEQTMNSTVEEQESFRDGAKMGFSIGFTGFLMFAGVGLILLFFVFQLISNPKKTVMSIIGLVASLVLYLILLVAGTSDSNSSLQLADDVQVAQGTINSTSAGLYLVIILIVVAVIAAVASPIMAMIKK